MTRYLLLQSLVSLLVVAPVAAFFQQDEEAEYMWCCQDALCLEACDKLCMHKGPGMFCPGDPGHPLSWGGGIGGGHAGHPPPPSGGSGGRKLDETCDPANPPSNGCGCEPEITAMEHSDWVVCQFCGPRPIDETTMEFLNWNVCYFDFFSGNGYSKQHCESVLPIKCCESAGCGGEPHFKTWSNYWYDYHGECDLNFIHAPSFADHLGLDIHIRTTIRDSYSFIETAAIKIGADVVEVSGFGEYQVNGVAFAGSNEIGEHDIGSFKFTHNPESKKVHHFTIDVGDHKIMVKTVKDFVSVTLDHARIEDYIDSVGMLGRFGTGTLLGRDGRTVFAVKNINDFGQEWQIRPDEPSLFQNTDRFPQYPHRCGLPDHAARESRRLGEQWVSEEEAQEACAAWSLDAKDKCIYDVLATGDLDLALVGAY